MADEGNSNESVASDLNEKQKKFCENFVFDWNQTRSYMAAYPDSNYGAAAVSAHDLLKIPKIQAYIAELKTKTAELAGVSLLRVTNEYVKLAFTDAANLRTDWNEVKEWENLTEAERALIAGVTTTKRTIGTGEETVEIEETRLEYKTHDKHKALEALRKMYGMDAAEKKDINLKTSIIDWTE